MQPASTLSWRSAPTTARGNHTKALHAFYFAAWAARHYNDPAGVTRAMEYMLRCLQRLPTSVGLTCCQLERLEDMLEAAPADEPALRDAFALQLAMLRRRPTIAEDTAFQRVAAS